MIPRDRRARMSLAGLLLAGLLLAGLLPACGLRAIKSQSEQIEAFGEIRGQVEVARSLPGQAYAVLLSDNGSYLAAMTFFPLTRSGEYAFLVPPGRYVVAAFVDASGDEKYQPGEPATYPGMETGYPVRVILPPDGRMDLGKLVIRGAIEPDLALDVSKTLPKAVANVGRVVSLTDPLFSRENAGKGYWRPVDYIHEFGGGLFMLQEYEEGKTPVVFVHGANGSALDFEVVIASLDRSRFQPWVLQYPSGVRLDIVSNYLLSAVTVLHEQHRFEGMALVAHSMGGLVARSFVMRHERAGNPVRILLAMTVNSPLYGMKSAKSGVAHSPIVVPSWRDVAWGSEFLQEIHAWSWPKEIPYYLVFSFQPGDGDDGVVPLESQLPLSLQAEATRIRGFAAEHTGVLQDEAFLAYFNETLAGLRAR
jgi:pimeloyl-ACP methyl ester carboxylesterase